MRSDASSPPRPAWPSSPLFDLAGYTANTAFWLARAAANLEVVAARARLHAARPEPVERMGDRDPQPRQGAPIAG